MSTYFPRAAELGQSWHVVDAEGVVLGRLAARVARLLRGKDNPRYTPFLSTGEHVIVINAAKVKVTGQKLQNKEYHHFTGYPGGLKTRLLRDRMAAHPERVVQDAIEGMLPKNRHGKHLAEHLHVYASGQHPHAAQQPQPARLVKSRPAAQESE
ncbi:MAG: 50S ribosomal protein L13 [Terriglobales bacterium]